MINLLSSILFVADNEIIQFYVLTKYTTLVEIAYDYDRPITYVKFYTRGRIFLENEAYTKSKNEWFHFSLSYKEFKKGIWALCGIVVIQGFRQSAFLSSYIRRLSDE